MRIDADGQPEKAGGPVGACHHLTDSPASVRKAGQKAISLVLPTFRNTNRQPILSSGNAAGRTSCTHPPGSPRKP